MSEMLFCVNTNKFHHEDSFDGHVYSFPPGEKVMVPREAAEHMFGVGGTDFTAVMHRKGWAFKYNPETRQFEEDKDGITKLKNFKWTKAKLIEQTVEQVEKPEK